MASLKDRLNNEPMHPLLDGISVKAMKIPAMGCISQKHQEPKIVWFQLST